MHTAPRRGSAVLLLALVLTALTGGCGYLRRGSKQSVTIETEPTNAAVEVNGKSYRAPVTLELPRNVHQTVTAKFAGGGTGTGHIQSETDMVYQIVDFFTCPIIGNIIDGATGGDSHLSPSPLVIRAQ